MTSAGEVLGLLVGLLCASDQLLEHVICTSTRSGERSRRRTRPGTAGSPRPCARSARRSRTGHGKHLDEVLYPGSDQRDRPAAARSSPRGVVERPPRGLLARSAVPGVGCETSSFGQHAFEAATVSGRALRYSLPCTTVAMPRCKLASWIRPSVLVAFDSSPSGRRPCRLFGDKASGRARCLPAGRARPPGEPRGREMVKR